MTGKASVFQKGDVVRAEWLETRPVALSGSRPKLGAREVSVSGTVRHIRGDHPTEPTTAIVFVDAEDEWDGPTIRPEGCSCAAPHVALRPEWIKEVLEKRG